MLSSCAIRNQSFRNSHNENIESVTKFQSEDNQPYNRVITTKESLSENTSIPEKKCIGPRASIISANATLSSIANILSAIYKQNVSSVGNTIDKIALNLKNVTIEEVLLSLLDEYDIGSDKTSRGYIIYSPRLRTKIFALKYHNFQRNSLSNTKINATQFSETSSDQGSSSIQTITNDSFWEGINRNIEMIISKPSNILGDIGSTTNAQVSVSLDINNGHVIVTAYPKALANVERFISHVNDTCLKQVVIEARILEIELTEEFNSGIDWNIINNVFSGKITNPDGYEIAKSDNILSSVMSMKFSNTTPSSSFDSIIKVLSGQGKVSVLSSPKISVLNNQRAMIKFGEDSLRVAGISSISSSNNTNNNINSSIDLKQFFSGISLDTTATIINKDEVILHIHPSITRVDEKNKNITISGQNTTLPLAEVATRETDTIVKSRSGDVIVIAGLVQSDIETKDSGPLASKAARLIFGSTSKKRAKKELVVLLMPIIGDYLDSSNHKNMFSKYLDQIE